MAARNFLRTCRAAYPHATASTRPLTPRHGSMRASTPTNFHRTCRGGYQPPAKIEKPLWNDNSRGFFLLFNHLLAAAEGDHFAGLEAAGLAADGAVDLHGHLRPLDGEVVLFRQAQPLQAELRRAADLRRGFVQGQNPLGAAARGHQLEPDGREAIALLGRLGDEGDGIAVDGELHGLVENLHEPAAAEGDDLTGLDVLGLVADDAVDVGVVGGADLGDLVALGIAETLDVEHGHVLLAGHVHAHGLELLGLAHTVAHLDPQRLQLGGLGGVLGNKLYDIFIDANFHGVTSIFICMQKRRTGMQPVLPLGYGVAPQPLIFSEMISMILSWHPPQPVEQAVSFCFHD